jgi:hypothetical protein
MPEIQGPERIMAGIARGRAFPFCQYGTSQFGFSHYGDDDIYLYPPGKDPILLTGIYRTDNVTGKTKYYREPLYITRNPQTGPQQTWRAKYADGVLAWQNLTQEQKDYYNKLANGKRYSGYNLFLKEYLLS